jgi:hypothetical protein
MRATLVCALLLVTQATPARAATEDECDRSWNTLDPNGRGVLRGDDAERFMDDMRAKGVQVCAPAKSRLASTGMPA